jgi:peptide/nickel transport system substrate-binding protein
MRLSGALAGVTLAPNLVTQVLAQDVKKGGHLTVSLVPEPSGILQLGNNPSLVIALNVSDGLVTYDKDFKPVPQLATAWETSEDGKVIRLKLREGVKWHDGTPLTATDVKFSIENAKKTNPIAGPTYSTLESVEAPDDHTVVLTFKAPSQAIWAVLDGAKTQILPYHIYKDSDSLANPNNNKPVGNGAFVFKEWVRGSHVTLVRNPDYWDTGKPYLDEITFRFIADAGARLIGLQTGEIQYAPLPAIPLAEAKRLQADASSDLIIEPRGWEANAPVYYLDFNLDREYFQDLRVRQAFAHAIDRKLLANNAFFGFATPATGPVASYQPKFYTPDTEQYEYSIDKAERLLDEAGLRKDANGVRLKIDNLPIPYGEDYVRASQVTQQLLKKVGIDVEIRNFDVATWINKLNNERDFDTSSTFGATFVDPQIGSVFRRYWSKANATKLGGNQAGYKSAEADRLIEAALIEGDPDRRRDLIQGLQKHVQKELPSISLLELRFFRVISKKLDGLNLTPFGAFASLADVSLKA